MKRNKQFIMLMLLFILSSSFENTQLLPTSLKVTVLDNLGNFVEGAEVSLFISEKDYRKGENAVAGPLKTDKRGKITFKRLEPISYYVHAVKEEKNNIGEGVKTAELSEGKINKVNTIIE